MSEIPFQWWLLGGILVVLVVRRFHRIVAAGLGLAIITVVADWGLKVYADGGVIGVLNWKFNQSTFLLLIGIWAAMELYNLVMAIRLR